MFTRGAINLFRTERIACKIYRSTATKYVYFSQTRLISKKNVQEETTEHKDHLVPAVGPKYKVYRDEDAEIIFDVNEEERRITLEELNDLKDDDPYEGINLKHGIAGVFDIEDVVELLRKENVKDIFVVKVAPELSYVDYFIVGTGKSKRHMLAVAEFLRKLYKLKKYDNEEVPKVEGENCNDWIALDLRNIAVHIFSDQARKIYDLETLWTVGSKYDDEFNKDYSDFEINKKHNLFLSELQPADNT